MKWIKRLKILIIVFLVFSKSIVLGQQLYTPKYWVFFKERDVKKTPYVSVKSQENRRMLGLDVNQISDFGPKLEEVQILKDHGLEVLNTSRWFNAVSVKVDNKQLKWLKKQPFIVGIRSIDQQSQTTKLASSLDKNIDEYSLPFHLVQIHAEAFFSKGLFGDSVSIGLIDGGFYDANKDPALSHLFKDNQVKAFRNFANPQKKDFFSDKESESDFHGTEVLKHIAGINDYRKLFYGVAIKSNVYLATTETSRSESRAEEDNWVAAIEWMDSLGVRLVNSSLGYSQGFSNPTENYMPQNMDGKTSVIAKGAQMAVNEKGMIVVVSAGNEGENKVWGGILSTPADVEGVISVGANDPKGLKMGYSSIGPAFLKYNKPDISVFSQYGTSFAAPVIAGFIAPILQMNPFITSKEVKEKLQKSGSLYPFPNNYLGYGFPNAEIILSEKNSKVIEKVNAKKQFRFRNLQDKQVHIIEKENQNIVLTDNIVEILNGQLLLLRKPKVKYTTLILQDKIIEICWK